MTARLIAIVLRFVALFMLPALVISLILGETGAVWGLLITMAVMALLSCLPLPFPPRRQTMYARDGFVVVAMTWFLISLLGALPFWISGAIMLIAAGVAAAGIIAIAVKTLCDDAKKVKAAENSPSKVVKH